MKKFLRFLLVATLFLGVVRIANAAIIGFDDISGNVEVTTQYASFGITFQQTFELDSWPVSYAPIKHPGDHIAYSGSFDESIFLFDNVITSFSLFVTSADNTIFLEAYDNNDVMLANLSGTVPIGNWYLMNMGLTGLPAQKIVIHNDSGFFAYDQITYSPVPEPCTFMLFFIGFIGFAGIKRRIHKSA